MASPRTIYYSGSTPQDHSAGFEVHSDSVAPAQILEQLADSLSKASVKATCREPEVERGIHQQFQFFRIEYAAGKGNG
jgi:hypothetical protein